MVKLSLVLLFISLLYVSMMERPVQSHAGVLSRAGDREPYLLKRDPFVPLVPKEVDRKESALEKEKSEKEQKQSKKEEQKKDKEKAATKKNPPPQLVLTGVVMGKDRSRAIIFDREHKVSCLVTEGMKMGNYQVTAISPGFVQMRGDSHSLHLLIKDRN